MANLLGYLLPWPSGSSEQRGERASSDVKEGFSALGQGRFTMAKRAFQRAYQLAPQEPSYGTYNLLAGAIATIAHNLRLCEKPAGSAPYTTRQRHFTQGITGLLFDTHVQLMKGLRPEEQEPWAETLQRLCAVASRENLSEAQSYRREEVQRTQHAVESVQNLLNPLLLKPQGQATLRGLHEGCQRAMDLVQKNQREEQLHVALIDLASGPRIHTWSETLFQSREEKDLLQALTQKTHPPQTLMLLANPLLKHQERIAGLIRTLVGAQS